MGVQPNLAGFIRGVENEIFQLGRIPGTEGFRIQEAHRTPREGDTVYQLTRDGRILDNQGNLVLKQAEIAPRATAYVFAQAKL